MLCANAPGLRGARRAEQPEARHPLCGPGRAGARGPGGGKGGISEEADLPLGS